MKPLPKGLVERFALEFSHRNKGFPLKAITPFFSQYESGLPAPDFDGISPRKPDHFVNVVLAMHTSNQRYALIDLCNDPPNDLKGGFPSENVRRQLLRELAAADGSSPLSVDLSSISLRGIREQWWTASSRLPGQSAAAVTASRALVESVCKTILIERRHTPDSSGNLQALFKQTRSSLGLNTDQQATRSVNQAISGLISVVNGLSSLSNAAGDRHGLEQGFKLDDAGVASIAVHAAGVVALALAKAHLEYRSGSEGGSEP